MVFDDFSSTYEIADSYRAKPQRRCDCGCPIARTSSLDSCHVCYSRRRKMELRQMTDPRFKGGRMAYTHYAARG